MKLPIIERIWRIDGFLELDEALAPAEAFDRLGPLLDASGTSHKIDGDTLTYKKDNPAAQDRLATFTRGTLQVVNQGGKARMHYTLKSHALALVFLAPLLFLGLAGVMIFVNNLERPGLEAKAKEEEAKKEAEGKEEDEVQPLHPIDVFLGAPAPEKPEDKEKDKDGGKDGREGDEDEVKERHSPTPAYVFAGLFALLYVIGRILEPWLVKRHFRSALNPADDAGIVGEAGAQQPG